MYSAFAYTNDNNYYRCLNAYCGQALGWWSNLHERAMYSEEYEGGLIIIPVLCMRK